MSAVVLTVMAAWLVLSILSTVVCALVARGGLEEDSRRGYLDQELACLLDADDAARTEVLAPGVPVR